MKKSNRRKSIKGSVNQQFVITMDKLYYWRQEVGIDSFEITSHKFRFFFVSRTEQTTVKIRRSSN